MPDRVMPFYVVCDESYSMADHIGTLNDRLGELHDAVAAEPDVAGGARLCVIGFSGAARIVTPLSPLSRSAGARARPTGAESNFGSAFALLRRTIQSDVEALLAESFEVCRPLVFFLSDGQPTDPAIWPSVHADLTTADWPGAPRMVAFGIGDADAATIGRVGTYRAFMSAGGVTPAQALHEFAGLLATSLVPAGPDHEVLVPGQVRGYTEVTHRFV
ncbi:MAG TPA: hypothetical protein VGH57_01280 [Amycolatopsis sp.]